MNLFYWFLLLVLQNAAFTWVSRARNSGSYGYHAIASVFSNGVYFVVQFVLISAVVQPGLDYQQLTEYGLIYISGTVTGSLLMHWLSINYLEKGKRRVGA